jgi:hypothetical protein
MSDFNKIPESPRIPLYNQKLIDLRESDRRETEGKTLQFLCYSIAEPLRLNIVFIIIFVLIEFYQVLYGSKTVLTTQAAAEAFTSSDAGY